MSSYTRAKPLNRAKTIQSLIDNNHLTPDGGDWLTLRLDPYHDFSRPITGYPDADCYDTIVSTLNYETNVSAPAGSAANWDAHIFTLPTTKATVYAGTSTDGQHQQTNEPYTLGLVNVAKVDSGFGVFPTALAPGNNFEMAQVAAFTNVHEGLSRVIGFGIEIIDTTAELYKQGALTAYRMPTNINRRVAVGHLNTAGTHQSQIYARSLQAPPSTVAEAVLYKGSVQWEAKKGAYLVVGQEGVSNPFESPLKDFVAISNDSAMTGTLHTLISGVRPTTALQAPPIMTASVGLTETKAVNCSQTGIILTGLANTATFKVRVRVYVERAPLVNDTALVPLASPSAIYDNHSLELYSKLVSTLPVAVEVSFNAKGDWWRWIIRNVGKVLPWVGKTLTPILGPEAAMIGNATGSLLSGASRKADAAEARRKAGIRQRQGNAIPKGGRT